MLLFGIHLQFSAWPLVLLPVVHSYNWWPGAELQMEAELKAEES